MLNDFPEVSGRERSITLSSCYQTLHIGRAKTLPKKCVSVITSVIWMTCLNIAQDASNRNATASQVSQATPQKLSPRFYYHCSFSAPISVCKLLSS